MWNFPHFFLTGSLIKAYFHDNFLTDYVGDVFMLTTPMRDGPPADVTIRNVRATEYGIKENRNGREQMNQILIRFVSHAFVFQRGVESFL